jgi:hypothetical protein
MNAQRFGKRPKPLLWDGSQAAVSNHNTRYSQPPKLFLFFGGIYIIHKCGRGFDTRDLNVEKLFLCVCVCVGGGGGVAVHRTQHAYAEEPTNMSMTLEKRGHQSK